MPPPRLTPRGTGTDERLRETGGDRAAGTRRRAGRGRTTDPGVQSAFSPCPWPGTPRSVALAWERPRDGRRMTLGCLASASITDRRFDYRTNIASAGCACGAPAVDRSQTAVIRLLSARSSR